MTINNIQDYINKVKWQTAKSGDHQYTIRAWNPDLEKEFEDFVMYIRKEGYKEKFYGSTYIYFRVDKFVYWTMGNELSSTTVINRRWVTRKNITEKKIVAR